MTEYPRPRKRLGQHFLTDPHILARIADALAPTGTETVVEIGPGRGALTQLLLERAARVVAIELDNALADRLRQRHAGDPRFTVINADVLDTSLAGAAGSDDFVLVGNVPYYITTPILFHALTPPIPRRAVFLVQREVADRVVCDPGSKTYGALSVNVQAIAVPHLVSLVPPGAFTPPPRVESAILHVVPRPTALVTTAEQPAFSRFVIDVFGFRRKQMRRIVRTVARLTPDAADDALRRADIESDARPETLSPSAFATLFRTLSA